MDRFDEASIATPTIGEFKQQVRKTCRHIFCFSLFLNPKHYHVVCYLKFYIFYFQILKCILKIFSKKDRPFSSHIKLYHVCVIIITLIMSVMKIPQFQPTAKHI